jgi:hypothetical protein
MALLKVREVKKWEERGRKNRRFSKSYALKTQQNQLLQKI